MKQYRITLVGCDDETEIHINLTQEEAWLIETLSRTSKQISTYKCMPTLKIEVLE